MEPAALLHMITEPTKNGLLGALRDGEHTVSELVAATGGEQSNVSHHLRQLRDAGLVRARRDGRHQRYGLADVELALLLGDLEDMAGRMDHVAFLANQERSGDAPFFGYG